MKFPSRASWLILLPFIIFLCVAAVAFSLISSQAPFAEDTTTEFTATVIKVILPESKDLAQCVIRTEEYGDAVSLGYIWKWVSLEELSQIESGDTILFRLENKYVPIMETSPVLPLCTLEGESFSIVSLEEREVAHVQEKAKMFLFLAVLVVFCLSSIVYFSCRIIRDAKARKGTNGRIV